MRTSIMSTMSGWLVKRGTLERQVADLATLSRLARDKRLKPTDLVFHPIAAQWFNASDVPEIKQAFAEQSGDAMSDLPEPTQSLPQETVEPPSATLPQNAPASTYSGSVWGFGSRVLAVIGGAVTILGGLTLLGLKAASENSLIEAVAHGIGIYCIGKGLFMMAAVVNFKAAVDFVTRQARDRDVG